MTTDHASSKKTRINKKSVLISHGRASVCDVACLGANELFLNIQEHKMS